MFILRNTKLFTCMHIMTRLFTNKHTNYHSCTSDSRKSRTQPQYVSRDKCSRQPDAESEKPQYQSQFPLSTHQSGITESLCCQMQPLIHTQKWLGQKCQVPAGPRHLIKGPVRGPIQLRDSPRTHYQWPGEHRYTIVSRQTSMERPTDILLRQTDINSISISGIN